MTTRPGGGGDLAEEVGEFLTHLGVERGLSPNTVAAYRRDLGQYLAFLEGRRPDPELVSGFVSHLGDEGLADSTVARKVAAIRGLHRFLVAEGSWEEDPTVLLDAPRRSPRLPRALDVGEVLALLEAPEVSEPLGRRDRALLEFLYATGARVSEAAGLDMADLDLEESVALVRGKGDRQRLVPMGRHAREAMRAYLPDRLALRGARDPGAVFLNARGRRLSRQGMWQIVRRHARTAGIPEASVSPHVLRHSAATHMVEGGADLRTVQEILGHASIGTTQVYTRVSPQHLREVYALSHPRAGRR